jgi:hypothetical protein
LWIYPIRLFFGKTLLRLVRSVLFVAFFAEDGLFLYVYM